MEKLSSSISRRDLVVGAGGAAVLFGLGGVGVAGQGAPLLRPPGAKDERAFLGACIRCGRCYESCPRACIEICGVEGDILSVRTPKMTYRVGQILASHDDLQEDEDPYQALLKAEGTGFCDFCLRCVENCPTDALSAFDLQHERIGIAVVESQLCIAFGNEGGCRKCVDYCLFDAISLDGSLYPVVDESLCNGCGLCENICPSATYRVFAGSNKRGINIEVEGNRQ